MGGDIVVTSRQGEGSTFVFTVPLQVLPALQGVPEGGAEPLAGDVAPSQPAGAASATEAAATASREDAAPERSLRVLVAEDNEVNRMVMEAILSGLGHAVAFAEDGEQAVSLASGEHWDIVLMDLHMPHMDGLEATRAIRALPHAQRSQVPIVALTADIFPETRERCEAAGVQDFLTKPVDTAELAACLQRLVPFQGPGR